MFETKHNSNTANDRQHGFSLIELLIVVAIILIIAAIAIPNLLRARMAANQAAAVSNIRTITSAAIVYSSTYQNGLPPSLTSLGGVGPANCNGAILLDEILTTPPYHKSGYIYDYQPQGRSNCELTRHPAARRDSTNTSPRQCQSSIGNTGQESYCSDEPGVIRIDLSGTKAASRSGLPGASSASVNRKQPVFSPRFSLSC